LGFLTLGVIWHEDSYDVLEVSVLYIMVVIAILLTATVTPSQAEYLKGLWRARKEGRSHLPWWDDLAINRVYLFLTCVLVLASANIGWSQSGARPSFMRNSVVTAF